MNIETREHNGVTVFDIEGEIRRSDNQESTLHHLVKKRLDQGERDILFNLAKVDFIDSYGVGEILASYISTQNIGGHFKIAGLSRKIYVVFQVTGLTKVLEIHDTEEDALRRFL